MNSNIKIAPSILASNFSKLNDEVISIENAGADFIHLDIMDGHFVPNLTFGPPIIKSLRNLTKLPFDVHLMVSNPDTLLDDYVNAGANIITVHVEACNHLARTLHYIKSKGCKAGVAINPHTDIQFIENVIEDLDLILIMTVNPGFGGQKFIKSMFKKISLVKEIISSRDIFLEVDGGITKENSKEVINAGANVLASGTRIEKLDQLKGKYQNIKILKFDISQSDKIEEFIENATKELGGNLDCIVNNAGVTQDNLAIRMSLEEWQKVININLTSTFLMSKSAIKKMLKNKSGRIVNITSVVGHTGNLGQANYTASKAGIIAMSKSLAIEYAKKNININCISPGFIKTAMTDKLDDKFKEVIISKIPSARLGDPDDVANAALFLCSNQSKYINGETLHVNGGMYMA